jgi:SAM-dependent methyltransferase
MQSDYARQYEDLGRRHWWWRARKQFVLRQLRVLSAQKKPSRILDIGCGNGLFFDELSSFGQVWGIEPDAGLVSDQGPWRSRIQIRPFDNTFAPADGKPFDWILMLDVLEHIQDDRAAAAHVRTLLAPGGAFLLTVPALTLLWSQHDVANLHYRRYTKKGLRFVLEGAGMQIQTIRYFFGWTIAPMLLRRALFSGAPAARPAEESHETPVPYRVKVPPGVVNQGMYAVSRLEHATIGRWGLPLGSSLVAIARRED